MNKIIKKGFTLIEILMVIVIISVLVAIALPKYIDTVDIALGKRAYDSMQTIYTAQMRFYLENNQENNHTFAANFNSLDVKFPSATANGGTMDFGKFNIILDNDIIKTSGLENYRIVFNLTNETKQCIVESNAGSNKASRICAALGGKSIGSGTFELR